MGVKSFCRGVLLGFCLSLVLAVSFCYADDKTIQVVGLGECADCKEHKIKTSQAFTGLRVTIDCKLKNGEVKRIGVGELDEEGKFKVTVPQKILKDGKLQEECYAQLHSASALPCAAHNGLEASKIITRTTSDGKLTFEPAGRLKFSSALCTSAFLWPFYKHPPLPKLPSWPPLPKIPPWKKTFPKIYYPPLKHFGHPFPFPPIYKKPFPPFYSKPLPPPVPIYKKPLPPPVPVYNPKPLPPPVPVYNPKPLPPPVPVYNPKPLPPPVPIYKPKPIPPPVPIYKPPVVKPPSVPIYKPKPKPPVFKPPTVPVYKPKPKPKPPVVKPPAPVYEKPLPPPVPIYKPNPPTYTKPLPPPTPIYKPIPPIYKKPCPPFSQVPTLPKLPPFPQIPPKYFHHPKIGYFPPLPPHIPHP